MDGEKQPNPHQVAQVVQQQPQQEEEESNEEEEHEEEEDEEQLAAEEADAVHSEISSIEPETALEAEELVEEPSDSEREQQRNRSAVLIRLEGTHTTATETDDSRETKRVSFYQAQESSSTDDSKETVREIMHQLIVGPMYAGPSCLEFKTAAKKRQQNEMSGTHSMEVAKRMRSEQLTASEAECVEWEQEPQQGQEQSPDEESTLQSATPDVLRALQEYLEAPDEVQSSPRKTDNKAVSQADTTAAPSEENPEIGERFRQIMEMFNNFTKNLESLEVVTDKKSPRVTRKKRTFSKDALPLSPRVHKSRYAHYLEVKRESMQREEMGNESFSSMDVGTSSIDVFDHMQPFVSEVRFLPEYKDMGTATSRVQLHSVGTGHVESAMSSNIACQTSLYQQQQQQKEQQQKEQKEQEEQKEQDLKQKQTLDYLSHSLATSVSATRLEMRNAQANYSHDSTSSSQQQLQQPRTIEPCADSRRTPTNISAKNISSDASGFTLVKISEPPSALELAPLMNAPCERTFHTIHIEATASPTPSIMQRPPLCARLWSVVTDFCAAICLCLQVNKDCIFCLGFFIAFVVSASFLTAFFYRTLSVNPQLFHHQHPQYPDRHVPLSSKDMYYV